jgi:Family of unknown function (DUF6687)
MRNMRFVSYSETMPPNVVVDGSPNRYTQITLSHWPKSHTPPELKADTSAEIVFRYLDNPSFHSDIEVVTNNHFDQDGLAGVFTLTDPQTAQRYRNLLIDVASAGDFGVYRSRDAARIAFAVSSLSESETSPFPQEIFSLPYPRLCGELYVRVLELFPNLLTNLESFRSLWEAEDAKLAESEALVKQGAVRIQEHPDLDLAVVWIPEYAKPARVHRFTKPERAECHPFAIHRATPCTRLLLIQGRHVEFQYRYESWVQFQSRKPARRVDLAPLAAALKERESSGGIWKCDGVDAITPRLYLDAAANTSIAAEVILDEVQKHLRAAPAAWDPYDSPGGS